MASTPRFKPARSRLGSRGFTRRVRGAYRNDAQHHHFLNLPDWLVEEIGWTHDRGPNVDELKLDVLVLSYLAGLWKRSRGYRSSFTYHDDVSIVVDEDEMVTSILSAASAIWRQVLLRPLPQARLEDKVFHAFYRSVVRACERLERRSFHDTGLLYRLGTVRPDVRGKAADLYGLRWSMAGSVLDPVLDRLDFSTSPPFLLTLRSATQRGFPDTTYVDSTWKAVNASMVYQQRLAVEEAWHRAFAEAGVQVGWKWRRQKAAPYLDWQCKRASKPQPPAHHTVGAWRTGAATTARRDQAACTIPYLVADIDAVDARTSYLYALHLLDRLAGLGVDLERVVVSFSGHRSFHVRLPHSLVGLPIYTRASEAKHVVQGFFDRLCDGVVGPQGPLIEVADPSIFSPLHLIRAIGSRHEKTDAYCIGFTGAELIGSEAFGAFPLAGILEHSRRFSPFRLPDPSAGAPSERLVQMLLDSARAVEHLDGFAGRGTNQGIIDRIRKGVAEGEEFHPGYVGRNRAALHYALYLLTHGGLDVAAVKTELERWNGEKNQPPLPGHELRSVLKSARRHRQRLRAATGDASARRPAA